MYIALRMDDITADMNWENFLALKELFDRYGVRAALGVVPACGDEKLHCQEAREDFWEYLKELQKEGWVLAQHGFDHRYVSRKGGLFPLNRLSEYAGLPFREQLDKIREGKRVLREKGIETELFMAPAHSYDRQTLRALKECGFRYVTDGFGKAPYRREGLTFLPIAEKKSAAFTDREGYTTLVLHANGMSAQEIGWYERMLEEHRDKFISYRELMEAAAVDRGAVGSLGEYLQASGKRILVKLMSVSGGRRGRAGGGAE